MSSLFFNSSRVSSSKLQRPFSIFKNPNRFGYKTREEVIRSQIKGFQDKVTKFKEFWSKKGEIYPHAFNKKKILTIDGENWMEETFDIGHKKIPLNGETRF